MNVNIYVNDRLEVYINKNNDKYTPNVKCIHVISKEGIDVINNNINNNINNYINHVYTVSKVDLRSIAKELNVHINTIVMCHMLMIQRRIFFNKHKAIHNALINLFMFTIDDQMYPIPLGLYTYDTIEAVLYEENERLTKENKELHKQLDDKDKKIEELTIKVDEQAKQIDEQAKQIDEQAKRIDDLTAKVDALMLTVNTLTSTIAIKDKHIEELTAKIDTLTSTIAIKDKQIEELMQK